MRLYGEFQLGNEYLYDSEALNSAFDQRGSLFFRGILDIDEVLEVQRDFVRELQRQGFVRPGGIESIWTGTGLDELDDDSLYGLDYYRKLLDTNKTRRLFERVFGEPIFTFRASTIRYSLPNDDEHESPAHQDHSYIRHATDFRTMWIPLMDIGYTVGGLALAERSHKRGLREHAELEVYSYVLKGRKQRGIPLENINEPWLTTIYHPGDVVVFHRHMVHWGLSNRSDRIRLSIDVRCQPASAPRSWQIQSSLSEQRQFRRDVQKIATHEGASEELFEALITEMMARGLKAGRAEVRGLMAELSGKSR